MLEGEVSQSALKPPQTAARAGSLRTSGWDSGSLRAPVADDRGVLRIIPEPRLTWGGQI